MMGVRRSRPLELRQGVGRRLRARREALDLRRSAVALHCGYSNLSKGSARIAAWERGAIGPLLNQDRYFKLLQLEAAPIQSELVRAGALQHRLDRLGADALEAERELLCTNAHRLLKRANRIVRDPKLSGIRTPVARLSLAYVGGGELSLGALVGAWQAGALVAPTPEHGPVYLFEGSGSPLSGAGSCAGVDRKGNRRRLKYSPSRHLPREARALWSRTRPVGAWSLADAVATLGGKAPRSHFWLLDEDAEPIGEPIASYNPRRRKLEVARGRWSGPGARGAVEGRQLGALRMSNGCLEGEGGWRPLKTTGPCPPPSVFPQLEALLSLIHNEEEPSHK